MLRTYYKSDRIRNNCQVIIRAIRSSDKEELVKGFDRLSAKSIYNRFFGVKKSLSESELKQLTEVDFTSHVALVAVMQPGDQPAGVGRFVILPNSNPVTAEVALVVDEKCHRIGIGTVLVKHLIKIGKRLGVKLIVAEVLRSNFEMLRFIQHLNLKVEKEYLPDCIKIKVHI